MCKSLSRTQCQCCKKIFCRRHFDEHDDLPNLQLNSFVDEINLLNDRLMAFNIDKLTDDSCQKLERWRAICHKRIDDVFSKTCRKIEQRVNEKIERQRDEICKMRSIIAEFIRKEETTMKNIDSLKTDIHNVKEKINNMEQIRIEVVVRPLVFDDTLIRIEELHIHPLDLSLLSPPYKTINHVDGSSRHIASNDRYFLIHQAPNLCLMDRDFKVIKRNRWEYDLIHDMCWSSALARFFIVTKSDVFTVDDNTMVIETIQIDHDQNWFSCTCSDTALYLSTCNAGSSILKFSLFPCIQFEKQWTFPETCAKNQGIMNIAHSNDTLALMIFDVSKRETLIELRLSKTLERLWSLKLDVEYGEHIFRCCSLNYGDWLVWDCQTSCLLHITKDGKLLTTSAYNTNPYHIILFHGTELIISAERGINFHRIKS